MARQIFMPGNYMIDVTDIFPESYGTFLITGPLEVVVMKRAMVTTASRKHLSST
jgi:hypothetical protein